MRVEGGEDENGGGARELVLELNQLMWVMGWSQYFGSPVPTDMVVLSLWEASHRLFLPLKYFATYLPK